MESRPSFALHVQETPTSVDTLIADIGAVPVLASSYSSTGDGPTLCRWLCRRMRSMRLCGRHFQWWRAFVTIELRVCFPITSSIHRSFTYAVVMDVIVKPGIPMEISCHELVHQSILRMWTRGNRRHDSQQSSFSNFVSRVDSVPTPR